MCDFADVVPDELLGLCPDWEIEFSINLLPSLPPISKAPYQMAPTESKVLKEQLQELLAKWFIHPVASQSGAPFFLVKKDVY